MDDSREHAGDARMDLRSYGRRKARKLSPRQDRLLRELLPRVAVPVSSTPLHPLRHFAPAVREAWLEIGFGGGEHLVWQAAANPDVGLIGCEPFEEGVVKVLDRIDRDRIANVRIHADDARNILRRLAPGSIARAFVLFPDPWPKTRHRKRRLVTTETLDLLANVMLPGGELRLATDIPDYARQMLLAARECGVFDWQARRPSDWRVRPQDWPATRYQQKADREGRQCYYLSFRRIVTTGAATPG
jgi:tRNA (guanine-N7-)-methyltransferase